MDIAPIPGSARQGSPDTRPAHPPQAAPGTGLRPTAALSPAEIHYLLGERRLGRLATADATGRPHVVPVGWSYNADLGTIDISGHGFAITRKYRNAVANPQAAFVVDDVLPPFRPRCVMVQGPVEALDADRAGGREAMLRIHPDKVVSWGLDA